MYSKDLYSIEEARELLGGISRNSIYHLLRDGKLASVPIGRRRFISASAIEAFILATTTTEAPEPRAQPLPPQASGPDAAGTQGAGHRAIPQTSFRELITGITRQLAQTFAT